MPSREDISIWAAASLTKYLKGYPFGLPLIFKQQAREKDAPTKDYIEVIFDGPNFRNVGTKNEQIGTIGVQVMVMTTYTPTDIYYHTRIKARAIEALSNTVRLQRIGGEEAKFDKVIVGLLKPVPTTTIMVTPVATEEPDASLVEALFSIELC